MCVAEEISNNVVIMWSCDGRVKVGWGYVGESIIYQLISRTIVLKSIIFFLPRYTLINNFDPDF